MLVCDWGTVIEIEPAIMKIFNMPEGTEITLINEKGKNVSFIQGQESQLYSKVL